MEGQAQSGDAAPETGPAPAEPGAPPRPRRRNRHPGAGIRRDGGPGHERQEFAPRERSGAPRDGGEPRARSPRQPGDGRRREPGERGGGRREPGRRDERRGGRGRDRAGPRTPERKLYSFDSIVDRGFDDVDEEAGTRRVHWTIIKRTVADQISRKAMSAAYVLQRDGVETEFSNLGSARSAVNKTIVHPEKLTRSKAEHAADKKK